MLAFTNFIFKLSSNLKLLNNSNYKIYLIIFFKHKFKILIFLLIKNINEME